VKSSYHVFSKSLRVHGFRGISMSSVLSKIFEHCVLNRFADFLTSSDNQFGFKKKMGCNTSNIQYEVCNRAVYYERVNC
jgi:hypothetical protein